MQDARLSDTPNVFVVYYKNDDGKEIKKLKSYFANNGFKGSNFYTMSIPHGVWYFVNLDNRIIAIGRIGIQFAKPYYDHAVTVDEFIRIDKIYQKAQNIEDERIKEVFKKYEGKRMMEF